MIHLNGGRNDSRLEGETTHGMRGETTRGRNDLVMAQAWMSG